MSEGKRATRPAADLYLDLLKRTLTRYAFGESRRPLRPAKGSIQRAVLAPIRAALARRGIELSRIEPFTPKLREEGRDWPAEADTMVGLHRLDNLARCVRVIVDDDVPGDLIETGVWRGGAAIFMRAALEVYGDTQRSVWLADSFRGLPKTGDPEAHADDAADRLWQWDFLAVPVEEVKARFERYGLLDERVRFLEGWFEDTLPSAPIDRLSLARLDGDMYESTMVALDALYPKLSVGGFLIVDDYGAVQGCRRAVDEFREREGIDEPLVEIDWTGVYWRKASTPSGAGTRPD